MRILILLLLFTAQISAQGITFKKGAVIDSIKVNDTLRDTYSLYLPTAHDGKAIFPVLFIFDGEGRGKSAARLFQTAAEQQGYILISSNNVDPSKSLQENLTAAVLLMQNASRSIPMDLRSVSVAGYGDGAKIATSIPLVLKEIHGVIYVGDQFFRPELLNDRSPFVSVGIVGNQQVNIGDMQLAHYHLQANNFRGQLYVFEGEKEWPDPQLIAAAVGDLTLEAMRSEKRPLDRGLIDVLYQQDLNRVNSLMRDEKYLLARDQLNILLSKYEDLLDIKEVKSRMKQLEKSEKYKEQEREYEQMLGKQERLWNDFVFYFNEDVENRNFENLGWWNFQKMELEKLTQGDNKSEAAMAFRLLDLLKDLTSAKVRALEEENAPLEKRLLAYMLTTVFDQQNYDAYKKVISLSTIDGDFSTALFYLEEMLKNGYENMDDLYEIEGTLGLKLTREYNWLIKKYLGSSRYFENATGTF